MELNIKKHAFLHNDFVVGLVYYGFPYFKIVSYGYAGTLIISDSMTLKEIKKIESPRSKIISLEKWNDNVCLVITSIGKTSFLSIKEPIQVTRTFEIKRTIHTAKKLPNDNILLVLQDDCKLLIISNDGQLLKELLKVPCWGDSHFILSTFYENSVYFNSNFQKDKLVHLINYEKNKIEKSFSAYPSLGNGNILSMQTLAFGRPKKEYLFTSGVDEKKSICVVDVDSETILKNVVEDFGEGEIFGHILIYDLFIAVGIGNGELMILKIEINENSENDLDDKIKLVKISNKVAVQTDGIFCLDFAHNKDSTVDIISGSFDKSVCVVTVEGMEIEYPYIKDKMSLQALEDENERIRYILFDNRFDEYYLEKEYLFKVVVTGCNVFNLFKWNFQY